MAEVNDTFMYQEQEYKIVFKNHDKQRISITSIGDFVKKPVTSEIIIINNEYYKVVYIHESKKRITLDLIERGD